MNKWYLCDNIDGHLRIVDGNKIDEWYAGGTKFNTIAGFHYGVISEHATYYDACDAKSQAIFIRQLNLGVSRPNAQ